MLTREGRYSQVKVCGDVPPNWVRFLQKILTDPIFIKQSVKVDPSFRKLQKEKKI